MRRVALCLGVVALLVLAAGTAQAAHPTVAVTTVKHVGYARPGGYYQSYVYPGAPVIVQPVVPGRAAVVYPAPGITVVQPRAYPPYRHGYHHGPRPGYRYGYGYPSRSGFQYFGKDFGISIGF
jgi:hypothetical protein